jgi:hypothetical protein
MMPPALNSIRLFLAELVMEEKLVCSAVPSMRAPANGRNRSKPDRPLALKILGGTPPSPAD